MNRVVRTFLDVMRIEVLLGIGLVFWVLNVEEKAEPSEFVKNLDAVHIDCTIDGQSPDKSLSNALGVRPPSSF